MSNNHPWELIRFNNARDGDVGSDGTPFGVRSPIARRAIEESFVVSAGKSQTETILDVRDGDVGSDGTPFGVRSPVARQAIDESFIAFSGKMHNEMFLDARDGDVGSDGTPFGVRSPVARRAIDDSFMGSSWKKQNETNPHVSNGSVSPDGTPVGVPSPVANRTIDESLVALSGKMQIENNRDVCDGDVGLDGTPFGVRSPIARSNVSTPGNTTHEQPMASKDGHHHSTINYYMVDDGNGIPTSKFCHTFASKSGVASMRSRAASVAWLHNSSSQLLSRSAIKRRKRLNKRKQEKQTEVLQIIGPNEKRTAHAKNFPTEYLQKNVVVFDGGVDVPTAPPSNPDVSGWSCHRIVDGVLDVCSPPSCNQGLMYQDKGMDPSFILLPRNEALKLNSDARDLCTAMANVARKKNKLVRGASKTVFGNSKYCCVGSRARRNAPGVEPGEFNLVGASTEDWDTIVSAVKRSEHAFFSYSGTDVIRHIKAARELSPWESIRPSKATDGTATQIFNGIAFGVNVYLRVHVDLDFTYSVIQVHTDNCDYGLMDDVVCYFSFPRLGVAVPLKPGDFLLINALEYHCLSSRCKANVDIFCVSSYLKTAIVGGNDNNRILTHKEMESLKEFPATRVDHKRKRTDT